LADDNGTEDTAKKPVDMVPPAPKKHAAGYRNYFRFFNTRENLSNEDYDVKKHGSLVAGEVPGGYELLDQYWIDEGRSLVYIALNTKTNQTEYLLFEPPLSEFEYELLERLHMDLLDVLILTSDEIKKGSQTYPARKGARPS
jgi:flagellar protein FlaI